MAIMPQSTDMLNISTLNSPNRHCVLVGKESVRIEERPVPKCGPEELLVYIMATGM